MNVKRIKINGVIDMNCYVINNINNEAIIIDPGNEKKKIQNYINSKGLKVKAILLTHAHIDHIGSLDCFEVPIWCSAIENEFQLSKDDNNGRNLWKDYFNVNKTWNYYDLDIRTLNDLDEITISNFKIKAYLTNGHSFGDMSYVINDKITFTGDCLLLNSIGRWDYPVGCDLKTLVSSVKYIVNNFKDDYICYPGHGEFNTFKYIKENNQFIDIFTSWSDDELQNWIVNNESQLKNWNEYAMVTFGLSLEQIKLHGEKLWS